MVILTLFSPLKQVKHPFAVQNENFALSKIVHKYKQVYFLAWDIGIFKVFIKL